MNYWFFFVMEHRFPGLWKKFVDQDIAAQQYPEDWPNEKKNIRLLQKIQKGDQLVAALGGHRFVGLGEVLRPFKRTGRSLGIRRPGDVLAFKERLVVEWHAMPREAARPYVKCDGRLARLDTNLNRGACVKRIDAKTFRFVRARLLRAGVAPLAGGQAIQEDLEALRIEEGKEGKKGRRLVNAYERDRRLRELAVRIHGVTCAACGFQFGSHYGERGDGYIEVHHVKPLGSLSRPTMVNPRTDMTVLCANCHRMIHRVPDRPLSLRQLRAVIGKARRSGKLRLRN
jgi:hypothetical protein